MMDKEKAGSIDAHAHWTPEGYVRAASLRAAASCRYRPPCRRPALRRRCRPAV